MASFISALALFILVLSNGCFTLPVDNEYLFNSTQQNTFVLQFTSQNQTNEHMELDISTPFDSSTSQYEDSTSTFTESSTFGVPQSDYGKREEDDLFSTSTESTTYITEQPNNDKREYFGDSFSTTDSVEPVDNNKREYDDDDLLLTTPELIAEPTDFDRQGDRENLKRENQVVTTTNDVLLFTSTSSSVAPQLYTSESSTSTSTGKYTGLLPLETDNHEEHEHEPEPEPEPKPTKPLKLKKKIHPIAESVPLDKLPSENVAEQDSKESTPRTAVYDQKVSDSFAPNFNGVMILDDNNTMVVTDTPNLLSISTKLIEKQEIPLNQGKESLHTEKKE
jgi:hypothetical protein